LALRANGKTILAPREEVSWTTLVQNVTNFVNKDRLRPPVSYFPLHYSLTTIII
jgi:hypothetical protein